MAKKSNSGSSRGDSIVTAKKKSSSGGHGGAIIASVLITLVIGAAGIYFALPLIFPAVKDPETVLQVKTQELRTRCLLWDNQLAPRTMNGSSSIITTQGGSYLNVEFSSILMFGVNSTFDTVSDYDFMSYNITMAIKNVKNYSVTVEFGELKDGQWGTLPFFMRVITPVLAAGSYNITMYWFSRVDATGSNYISANHPNNYLTNPRTLYVEEIAS